MRGRLKIAGAASVVVIVAAMHLWNSPWLWRAGSLLSSQQSTMSVSSPACISEGKTLTVAAVLRNRGDGWFAIEDDGHAPVNVSAVDTEPGALTVHFPFTASRVNTFVVTPDETLAAQGYFAGASVALDRATIKLSQASVLGAAERSPIGVSASSSNLWVYGLFEGQCP